MNASRMIQVRMRNHYLVDRPGGHAQRFESVEHRSRGFRASGVNQGGLFVLDAVDGHGAGLIEEFGINKMNIVGIIRFPVHGLTTTDLISSRFEHKPSTILPAQEELPLPITEATMKHVLVTYRQDDGPERTYVLEGDRRQSTERILRRGLEELVGTPVEPGDDENVYRTEDDSSRLEVENYRLLDEGEVDELKRKHITRIVNENVTEPACRVRY